MTAAPDGAPARRIGVFGGTFDPPHLGHVTVAREVADALDLERVLWVPAGVPPHKMEEAISPSAVRTEMTEEAAACDPRFEVCDAEVRRAGPSYTVDTLRTLRATLPDTELFLILGADLLRTLATAWRAPEEVLRLATPVLIDRGGVSALGSVPEMPGMKRAVRVPVTRVDVSSSEIRARVSAGLDVSAMVPETVLRIILREGLYTG